MPLYEMEFRIQHDCPYNDLSRRHPDALIAMWCNYRRHVLEISCKDMEAFHAIQDDLRNQAEKLGIKILRMSFIGTNLQMVIEECGCRIIDVQKRSVTPVLEKYNCLEIQPAIYSEGWERYRIVAFSQEDVKSMFQELKEFCTFQILSRSTIPLYSVRDSFVISTSALFSKMTKKQLHALLAALDHGYYRVPKRATTDEIARHLGLPRTTYEEHLRKAESKLLHAVTPYIRIRT